MAGVTAGWDAVVVGLGAMGSAALWQLAARGARAAGVDRFAPPHDRGSSHGDSRIIRSAYFEDPAYVPLVQRAFALWRALEAETDESLLVMSGAAMIGAAASQVVRGAVRAAEQHGLRYDLLLDAAAAAERLPQHRFGDGDAAMLEPDGGVLRPERCVAAMLRRAAELGAPVRTGTVVQRVELRGDGARVHVRGGEVLDAAHVVVCAGPWTAQVLPELALPLRVERQVTAWFAVDDAAAFAPEAFPVFIRELPGGRLVYGIPSLDGATVKLAVHHEGDTVDPDTVSREVTERDLAPLRDFAAQWLRGVEPRAVRAVTCLYTDTPDEHFVVDRLPDGAAATLVSACSGHGFKFAPAVGEAVAGMALGGPVPGGLSPFSLGRFAR